MNNSWLAYEKGLAQLSRHIPPEHPEHERIQALRASLLENIKQARSHDPPELCIARKSLVADLNSLTQQTTEMSFIALCISTNPVLEYLTWIYKAAYQACSLYSDEEEIWVDQCRDSVKHFQKRPPLDDIATDISDTTTNLYHIDQCIVDLLELIEDLEKLCPPNRRPTERLRIKRAEIREALQQCLEKIQDIDHTFAELICWHQEVVLSVSPRRSEPPPSSRQEQALSSSPHDSSGGNNRQPPEAQPNVAAQEKRHEASFQQAEQGSTPPDAVQLDSQSPGANSAASEQNTAPGRETSGAGFPHGYAVIVGIATYRDPRLQLSEAIVKDVMDMHTTLRAADYCGYIQDHVRLRYDAQATANTIRDDLRWLAEATAADEKATALFYFSGHGERIAIDGQSPHHLIPYDCNLDDLEGTTISGAELAQLLHAIRASRLLVLLDSCYAGGFDEIKDIGMRQGIFKHGTVQEEQTYYERLAQGEGRIIIASSRSTEVSQASPAMNNSLFTRYLIEGLRGKAHTQEDGLIRVYDLYNYIAAQVAKHQVQRPVMTTFHAENFPVALYRGGQKVQAVTQQPAQRGEDKLSEAEIDFTVLREKLVQAFSLEELRVLCADLRQTLRRKGINELFNLEMLEGAGLAGKAQGLIDYSERRGWLNYLMAEIRKARPNLSM